MCHFKEIENGCKIIMFIRFVWCVWVGEGNTEPPFRVNFFLSGMLTVVLSEPPFRDQPYRVPFLNMFSGWLLYNFETLDAQNAVFLL